MADDNFLSGKLPGYNVSPVAPGRVVSDKPFAVSGAENSTREKPKAPPGLRIDGFSLESVTPEIAAKLLSTSLMSLSDDDIARSRLGMLRLALEKIRSGLPLDKADEESLFLASAILRSAPRMITADLAHDAAEYKQEEIRELVDQFIAIASSWGVVIYREVISA